ncbi:hypothetical protein CH249_06995 [Rhodococcus sp. 05-2255-3B1]|uniref:TatD family hydrolase n=1 Tax=unclassified Rhodococcus (in: high G+C Gram-positive bacteria) TaxID=192944 RepID=UPI000B9B6A13|nr:hypothetical protein CH250_11050 [Rhodococcus sp. 05-2255-3C]OZE14170.1 hypothetical protein CH249_06995 [Rhodococcus sp. 05-2255-3B1]OZE24741.1 hypothetical protein CH255_00870 [Rhodococcus sp. 05-2255-2A2]
MQPSDGRAQGFVAVTSQLLPLDTHAHIDTGIAAPDVAELCAFVFAMTRSLAEFTSLTRHDTRAIWGLGAHPALMRSQKSFDSVLFRQHLPSAVIVGEVGLDGKSRVPMELQRRTFREILEAVAEMPRIMSIHSTGAQAAVIHELNRVPVDGAVLHWWTGSAGLTEEAIRLGCYFSVPPGSTGSAHINTLRQIPKELVLPETDHPSGDRRGPHPRRPGNVSEVEKKLATIWSMSEAKVRKQLWLNLAKLAEGTSTLGLFNRAWQDSMSIARNPG